MPFISWDETLSVGLETFDKEHKQLVELVNKLHIGMISGEPHAAMDETLDGLAKYTATHFKHEEELMSTFDFPEIDEHMHEHKKLLEQVSQFHKEFHDGKTSFTIELMQFLRDWLANHIKETDKKYSEHFKANGIK